MNFDHRAEGLTGGPGSAQRIAERLMKEFGYRPPVAERVAQRMLTIDPTIRASFWRWWRTGALDPDLEVEGYTIERLMSEHQLNPVAAFSTLNGLKTNPTGAVKRGVSARG